MNKLSLVAVVSSLLLVPAVASAAPAEMTRYTSNGEYASLQDQDGDNLVFVTVGRDGTPQSQTTNLSFYTSSCTYTDTTFACTGVSGWGQIPNGDFDVNGASGNAQLVTDTSGVFAIAYSYSCDWEAAVCTFEESPAEGGIISLSWQRNREYKYSSEGRTEINYLNYRYVSQGRSNYTSASAEGDVLGQSIASNLGSVGTSHNRTMTIVRN